MTLRNLQNFVSKEEEEEEEAEQYQQQQQHEDNPQLQQLIERVRGKPFYEWVPCKKGVSTSFNKIIGYPRKNGITHPLYDYEKMVFNALFEPSWFNKRPITPEEIVKYGKRHSDILSNIPKQKSGDNIGFAEERLRKEKIREVIYPHKVKHVAVLKAAGLGITELALRIIAWLCMRNDDLKGSQIVLFTGPRLELAVSLIQRLKDLFRPHGITFTDKETVLNLNGVRIEAFPSFHSDSARGLPNISCIFCDEFSFFPDHEIDNIMDIMLRNIPKSDPYLLVVSTPQKPNDAMDRLLKEPFETTVFKRLYLDFTYGIGKLYTQEDIDKIKSSRSFEREYNLKFAGVQGNVISPTAIDRCLQLGEEMDKTTPIDDWSIQTKYVMAIDAGYGSSNTAITVSRFVNGKVQLIYSKEFTRPNFSDIIDEVWRLKRKCPSNCLQNIIIDASNSELYTALSTEFKQNPSPKYLADKQAWCKKINAPLENHLFVVPVPFSVRGREMLSHLKWLVEEQEDDKAMFALDKRFEEVVTCLRTAQATEGLLSKADTVFDDTFDSLRLNLSYYRRSV